MGTNPRYIGRDTDSKAARVDRLQSRIGYKVVSVTFNDKEDHIRIQPPHFSESMFELSDNSKCDKSRGNHDLVNCSCGFYAYNTLEAGIEHWTSSCAKAANEFVVEVALSGEVVVAEKGYRATHQRVTRMYLPHCFKCANRGEVLAFHQYGFLVPACKKCAGDARQMTFQEFSERYSPEGFSPIQIVASQNLTRDIDLFKRDEDMFREVQFMLDKIAAAGKMQVLSDTINYASQKLEASLGFDQEV